MARTSAEHFLGDPMLFDAWLRDDGERTGQRAMAQWPTNSVRHH